MSPSPLYLVIFFLLCFSFTHAQDENNRIQALENPITTEYLKKSLRKTHPRLVLTPTLQKSLTKKVETDPVLKNFYQAIQQNADRIFEEALLERKKIGRRLLSVSREMLYRMNMLGMVYVIEKDRRMLDRIQQEIEAVCQFSDWNPSHYLDVAEMSLAVAIGLDWCYKDLPKSTVELAEKALIEKGINPSYNPAGNVGWIKGSNNWNQVCHAGMIAAALMVAERVPELASKTLHRAIEGIPYALVEYGPDGAYPEGSTYWGYGTSFSVLTIAMLRSALGEDYGIAGYPAFIPSAMFRQMCNAPSGMYYNFADCGDRRGANGDITLAWFATETGNSSYFERDRFLQPINDMGKLSRYAGAGLVWLSQYKAKENSTLPTAYMAEGANPIVIFRDSPPNQLGYYLGAKGGRGTVNHGNMDGGSFIYELNGVRWVVDPGNQNYHALEKTGFNLWGRCQDCERWTLLTKNNYGHSTLTVNGQLHQVDGMASIVQFHKGAKASATIDLGAAFGDLLSSAYRTFIKDSPSSILIEDEIRVSEKTEMITWQLMTQAEVTLTDYGALLSQEGKQLKLENKSHPEIKVSIISLDPPPLELDRKIPELKRLELRIPAYTLQEKRTKIIVRLSGKTG